MASKTSQLASRLGSITREARQRLSMTQQDVADSLGITTEVYGRIERGHMLPSASNLRRLSQVLSVSAHCLLGLDSGEQLKELDEPAPVTDPPELRRLIRQLERLEEPAFSAVVQLATLMYQSNHRDDSSETDPASESH